MNVILEKDKVVYKDLDGSKMIADIEVGARTATQLMNSSMLINNRPDIELGVGLLLDTLVTVNDMITLCMDISMNVKEKLIKILREHKISIKVDMRLTYRNIIIDIEDCNNNDYKNMINISNDIHKIVSELCMDKHNISINQVFDSIIEIKDECNKRILTLDELKSGNKYNVKFNASGVLIHNINITNANASASVGEVKIYEDKYISYCIDLNYSEEILNTLRNKRDVLSINTILKIIDNTRYYFNEI